MPSFFKIILIVFVLFSNTNANYCSNEICRRCCAVTNTGKPL